MADFIEIEEKQIKLKILVKPRSSRAEWGKLISQKHQKYIQLKIPAPPTDGKANKACVKFVSKQFGAPKTSISILQGKKNRYKIFLVKNYNPDKLQFFLKSRQGQD